MKALLQRGGPERQRRSSPLQLRRRCFCNVRRLLLLIIMASVAILTVFQGALWSTLSIQPTPFLNASSMLSEHPSTKTITNTKTKTNTIDGSDIPFEKQRKRNDMATKHNSPIKTKRNQKINTTHHNTITTKNRKLHNGKNITFIRQQQHQQISSSNSAVPLVCRHRNRVLDHLIVEDDTNVRPEAVLSTNTANETLQANYRNTSTVSQSSLAVVTKIPTINTTIKLICFVMTYDGHHDTRIAAVRQTWGSRCDSLIIASNTTDPTMGTIAMESEASYNGLWGKLNETMQYVYHTYHPEHHPENSEHNNNNQRFYNEWIVKADDDSYLIIENLRTFLASQQVQELHNPVAAVNTNYTIAHDNDGDNHDHNRTIITESKTRGGAPLIYGRIYSAPQYKNLEHRPVYFANPVNVEFGKRFYAKMNPRHRVLYNYGGSGYVMNWNYVEKFVDIMKGPDTVHGIPPEDQAHGVVMAYHDIWPQQSLDELGRQRFHQEPPSFMYNMIPDHVRLFQDCHSYVGGIKTGPECCSTNSISFHHMKPVEMRKMDNYLYSCRRQQRSQALQLMKP